MAYQDLCKDILRAGQGGLISSVLRTPRHYNMDRPETATPSSRMHLSTFGQSHTNVYTESVSAGSSPYWVSSGGGITLPDPPPGKILSPLPTRCVCVCLFPPSPVRFLRSHVTGGGVAGDIARIAHKFMLGNNVGWIVNIDVGAVEYLRWCYWYWTMFRVMFYQRKYSL